MDELQKKSVMLQYYKREDVRAALVQSAKDREVAIRYGDRFGKRPDTLSFAGDVLNLASKGATSFHFSEELWTNPLQLDPNMTQAEQNDLRKGWDLVIDIDFEEWESSKMIAQAMVKGLREHGISTISCKFSGNKGFHIGVPFESFPEKVHGEETRLLFPEGVRRVAAYLTQHIDKNNELSEKIMESKAFKNFLKDEGRSVTEFTKAFCSECHKPFERGKAKPRIEFICPRCGAREIVEKETQYMQCDKCKVFMDKFEYSSSNACSCGSEKFYRKVDLKIDTVLISSRHMFRSPYSLHEKSLLVSVPINPYKIMEFYKEQAKPEDVVVGEFPFLDRSLAMRDEANRLLVQAFDHKPKIEAEGVEKQYDFEELEDAAPVEYFPPCIKTVLGGMKDGKKRSMFILTNFLANVGWNPDQIEELLLEWNKKNPEPLKEVLIKGHMRYHRQRGGQKVLPPNCDNKMYYKDLGICCPDQLCKRIKNPVNYTRRRVRMTQKRKSKS